MSPKVFQAASAFRNIGRWPTSGSKRRFLSWLMGGSMAAFIVSAFYPIVHFLLPERAAQTGVGKVAVGSVWEILPGASRKFKFGRYPSIAMNYQGAYYAYGAICTHLGCIVHWADERGCSMEMGDEVHCVCHAGHYDLKTGRVISGPPPSPLPKLRVAVEGETLYALGWEDEEYVAKLTTYR